MTSISYFNHIGNLLSHVFYFDTNVLLLTLVFDIIITVIICKMINSYKQSASHTSDSSHKKSNKSEHLILIGITGRKRSGKDTIGNHLVDNYGFKRVAFADALKEACKIIFGLSNAQVYGDELKEVIDEYWNHSPREILQKVGTELFREQLPKVCEHINNDIWIRSVERKIINLRAQGHTRIIVTDVRFPNEHEFISTNKGYNWKVIRPDILKKTNDVDAHASEIMIDNFKCDKDFINNATLKTLYNNVDEYMKQILKNHANVITPQEPHSVTTSEMIDAIMSAY